MLILVLGLVLFFGLHSIRVFAEGWRTATIARIGERPWKAFYSVISIAGFVMIVWGYGAARNQVPLWDPPAAMRHVTAVLMLPVFVLFLATYIPRNGIRGRLHHPMLFSIKLWAFAHLVSNGNLADVLLFGGFLAWAILVLGAATKRDREAARVYEPGTAAATIACVLAGMALYAAFVFGLHAWLIGVPVAV
jgi:uncharacterized membrane protein